MAEPLNFKITSPDLKPALAAGEFGVTCVTNEPSGFGKL